MARINIVKATPFTKGGNSVVELVSSSKLSKVLFKALMFTISLSFTILLFYCEWRC